MAMMGLMAALALAKNQMIDQPAADRKRKYESQTAALSPWTGMKSEFVQDPNAIGAVIGGAGAGAAMGSQMADTNLANSLAKNPEISGVASDVSPGDSMAGKIGDQASSFSDQMNKSVDSSARSSFSNPAAGSSWSDVSAEKPQEAWFYGQNPSPYSQPSLSSPATSDSYGKKYKSILDAGLSPESPESKWQINPFKANY